MQTKEQNISPIKQRILHYAASLGGSKREFYASIGVSRGTLESKTGITEETMAKFIATHPDVNIEWLLTGRGNMLKSEHPSNNILTEDGISKGKKEDTIAHAEVVETRPRIPLEAAAGSLSVLTQSINQSQCDQIPVIASLPDYDFTIMVKGDSMMPEFKSGDEVACRLIRESAFIQWGQPYVVDSYNGIVLKRIHDSGDCIKCVSDNPQYGTFHIPKSEIYRLALVVGMIRSY